MRFRWHFIRWGTERTYCGRSMLTPSVPMLEKVSCLSCLRAIVADARRAAATTRMPILSKQRPFDFRKLY
jgi:hypothetical protein